MVTKHTPAPWTNDRGIIKAAGGLAVARVFSSSFPADAACNGDLIAAAPDLLEAAKAMDECSEGSAAFRVAFNDLRAAVAKAEGGGR